MRLWHYKLVHYLPDKTLIDLWNDVKCLYDDNKIDDIFINYIKDYNINDLYRYIRYVMAEMLFRSILVQSVKRFNEAFKNINIDLEDSTEVFKNKHTTRYLIQNYFLLEEMNTCDNNLFKDSEFENLFTFTKIQIQGEMFDDKDN